MALTDAQMQAIQEAKDIDTGVDSRSRKEMLAEQMSDLKTIGKVSGELAVESIPGVSEEISMQNIQDALARGDKVGAGIETAALGLGALPLIGDVAAKGLRKFNKTRKAYKLFVKGEDGELYPLFVDANQPVKKGEFLEANFPDVAFKGKRGATSKESFYVPTKGAERSKGEKPKNTGTRIMIPDEETRQKLIDAGFITDRTKRTKEAPFGKVTAVAARPGWHSSQMPVATHLGPQDLKVSKKEAEKLVAAGVTSEAIKRRGNQFYVKRRAEDQVFAEVEMADDVDYQSMLAKEGRSDINDRVPKGGSYRYSDGQADSDQWVVGGDMRVNRELSREEARKLQEELGVKDLPYRDEVESILGRQFKFNEGGLAMLQGVDDYMLSQTDPEKMMRSKELNMNKGGIAQQMELFDDGGLKDEGGTIDPISGNEVPSGSTQEEVRDDIPAQLSEGEFVFPADVVRFIGLEKLMMLRQEAKAGLQRMEDMGQMGNSEEAILPDNIPFDISDLDMEDDGVVDFAQGGVVQAQQGTFVQPGMSTIGGFQPSQFTNIPTMTPSVTQTPNIPTAPYQPPMQQATPIAMQGLPNTGLDTSKLGFNVGPPDEFKTFKNESGQEIQVPFKGGKVHPTFTVPQGFTEKKDEAKPKEETKVESTVTQTRPQEEGESKDSTPEFSTTDMRGIGYDRGKIDNEDLLSELSTIGKSQVASLSMKKGLVGSAKKEFKDTAISRDEFLTSQKVTIDSYFSNRPELGETRLHELSSNVKQDLANELKNAREELQASLLNADGTTKSQSQLDKEKQEIAKESGLSLLREDRDFNREKTYGQIFAEARAARNEVERQASAFNVDTRGKSRAQIKSEIEKQKQVQRDRIAERARIDREKGVDSQAEQAYSSTGQDASSSSAASYSGRGITGEFGMAKGGMAKQMKQSGLASK